MVQSELNKSLIYALRQMSRATYQNAIQNPNTLEYANTKSRGEIVSYNLINEISGVKIYRIVYNSLDNRSGLVSQMSGTLYIPNTIKFQRMVSHKHPTYTTLDDSELGHVLYQDKTATPNFELSAAILGNVVITSDGVGYGVSTGKLHYMDYASESMSQVDAVRAVRNLCLKNKSLFPGSTMSSVSVLDVFQTGYSLGGMFSVSVANELVSNIPEKGNFNIVNVVCGAAINASSVIKQITALNLLGATTANHKIPYNLAYFICLYFYGRRDEALVVLNPHVVRNVLPLFEDAYSRNQNSNTFYMNFRSKLTTSMIANNPLNYTVDDIANSTARFDVRLLLDINELKDFEVSEEECDFTHRFLTFRSLSNSPVSVVYSTGDELSFFNNVDGSALYDANISRMLNKTVKTSLTRNDTIANAPLIVSDIKALTKTDYLRIPVSSTLGHQAFALNFYGIVLELLRA